MESRIVCSLVHPSKIGHFHKDNPILPILFVLVSMAIYLGIYAWVVFTGIFFTTTSYTSVSNLVIQKNYDYNVVCDGTTMTGDEYTITSNGLVIKFMPKNEYKPTTNSNIEYVFTQDHVDAYLGYSKVGTYTYQDLGGFSFSLANMKKNTTSTDIRSFEIVMERLFDNVQPLYRLNYYLSELYQFLIFFGVSVLAAFIFSFYVNPDVSMKKRLKLIGYDSVSFSVVMLFSLLFTLSFLSYVAIAMPVLYSFRTFKHIRRRKESNNEA